MAFEVVAAVIIWMFCTGIALFFNYACHYKEKYHEFRDGERDKYE